MDVWQSTLADGQSQRLIQQTAKDHEYVAPIGDCRGLMATPDFHKFRASLWDGLTLRVYEHGRFQYIVAGAVPQGVKVISFEQWREAPAANP